MVHVKAKEPPYQSTSHRVGLKRIIEAGGKNALFPQVAVGFLDQGEIIELHEHLSLVEHYFILNGKGRWTIDGVIYVCDSGDYLKIPNKTTHKLEALTNLEFFYYSLNTNYSGKIL